MDAWRAQYGPTFKYPGLFGNNLHTSDLLALQHILKNVDIYQRPTLMRKTIKNGALGRGLLAVEGEEHRNLRKIMNPAFGVPQVRDLGEIFLTKSVQLCDNWLKDACGSPTRIDVLVGLRSMTLDVIALAGFNYDCNSLDRTAPRSELDEAFAAYFQPTPTRRARLLRMVQLRFPILLHLPFRANRLVQRARASMDRIGRQLLEEGKATIEQSGGGKKYTSGRRDVLSLLLKVNVGEDIPANKRLSDEAVLAQIPTFFVAGNETTSTGTAWALYALALHPAVQEKLRVELRTLPTDTPSVDALNGLSYLESVVKEVLRLHPPICFTIREAQRDDVLPLRRPYTDTKGQLHRSVVIAKGQLMQVPILAVNRDKTIWGADAEEFRPERWGVLPDSVKEIPGIYAHLLTFLGGPHNCIGSRFSLLEMKALLFTLVRAFEFEMAVPRDDIGCTTSPVGSPFVRSQEDKGTQMPLLLKPCHGL
ncbi:cytochrome P450 [Mycena leptocephala]|nr:cytochrome P450 [Mycena leptocephala]